MGRFINADVFVATGQGLLGNNMFAYCGNNCVSNVDSGGDRYDAYDISALAGGGIVIGGLLLRPLVESTAQATINTFNKATREVYDFSNAVKAELQELSKKTPHVHHIVPVGNFSSRSPKTQQQISELHNLLSNAGINRYIDPMNLMLVSSGTHASLHTDQYISHVYNYIMSTNGSKEQIYGMLFCLRIEIAAIDVLASGY